MFGPENIPSSQSEEERLMQEFENDPLEKEAREAGQKWAQEIREQYPTPESVAKNYRDGHFTLQQMQEVYTEEEIEQLLEECRRLEAAGE